MILLAIPMIILYFVAAGIAAINDARLAKKAAKLLRGADTGSHD
jgi:Sec-independent protein secretion pathway component TatC